MNKTNAPNQNANTNFQSKKPRPENKDNLDSRKNEEQKFKGDDVTNNEKDTQNEKPSFKKEKD